MRLRNVVASCVLAVAVMVAAACSPSGDASTFHEQNPDSGQDNSTPPGSLGSSDAGSDGAADASCAPTPLATFAATWAPPKVTAGACTSQEIADAYDACFAPPVDMAKCTDYKGAHTSCATCVSSEATDSTHGPLVWQRSDRYFTVNVAGCLAIEQGNKAPDSCAAAFDAAVNCKRTACDACGSAGALNFQSLSVCENTAGKSGACQMLGSQEATACGDLLAPDASTLKCFEASGETTRDLYLRLAPLFCK